VSKRTRAGIPHYPGDWRRTARQAAGASGAGPDIQCSASGPAGWISPEALLRQPAEYRSRFE
jgi:predicted nucleic acid-binding Zn ribbon protein